MLEKIQNLSERNRKIILWSVVTIISFIFLFFGIKNFQKRLESFQMEGFKKELNLPL